MQEGNGRLSKVQTSALFFSRKKSEAAASRIRFRLPLPQRMRKNSRTRKP